MNALTAFLHPAVVSEEKEIVISKRFLDEEGKPVPFRIRSLTQEENEAISKAATHKKRVGDQWQEELDAAEYSSRMIVEATVFPDMRNAELCETYGTKDPVQLPSKLLLAGEYNKLVMAITKLSGFDKTPDEEVKN